MLTQAPLPSLRCLLRALLRDAGRTRDVAAPWHREGELAGWLSRSAWSLALIALWRQGRVPGAPPTVWLPDYFCNSSLAPLRQTGARLVFYPLDPNMGPDINVCRMLAASCPVDVFVLVHYFGQPRGTASVIDFCRHVGAWLVEDAAHALRPCSGIGEKGDFVLYSPHKLLPLPDGAVLVVRPVGPSRFGSQGLAEFAQADNWPAMLEDLQQSMGNVVKGSEIRSLVWLAKRALQKLGLGTGGALKTPFEERLSPAMTKSQPVNAPSMSMLARRLVAVIAQELGHVACWRQRNQLLWDFLLTKKDDGRWNTIVPVSRTNGREWTPYLADYAVANGSAAETYKRCQMAGLPVSSWPDLPPEVLAQPESHRRATDWRQTRLFVPVHQSLSSRTMLQRCHQPRPHPLQDTSLRLDWDTASPDQWARWIKQAGKSNLLQSWAYGAAKTDDSGWRAKRGVFYQDNEPIAFVQVLQKRIAGVALVSRINRGPLALKLLTDTQWRAIWAMLADLGSLWRGALLSAAPELDLSGSCLANMTSIAYRQFSPSALESVWLDLAPSLPALRKGLDGKWRNMLNFAEKSGLVLEVCCDDQAFEWMLARYRELMNEKDFTGPPISLLRCLRRHLKADEQPLILRAIHNNVPVAGICLVRHGSAATYLLGWNGPAGRRLKANQFLLWGAIEHLKRLGLDWFDLGGISEKNTPGITAFKLGIGGIRYELVGEFWKW